MTGSSSGSVFGQLGCFKNGTVLWALFCALREDEQDAVKLRQSITYVELLSRRAYAMNMSSASDPTSAEFFSPLGYAVMLNLPQLFRQILNASNVDVNQPRVRNRGRHFVGIPIRIWKPGPIPISYPEPALHLQPADGSAPNHFRPCQALRHRQNAQPIKKRPRLRAKQNSNVEGLL